MSFYNGTPNVNAFQKVRSVVGSFFQNLFPTQEEQPAAPAANTDPLNLPDTYQIGPNDISLDQVANNLGVPLQQLVDVNDGAKTLPPVGSFMAVKPLGPPKPPGYDAGAALNNVPNFARPTSYNPQYGLQGAGAGGRGNILPTAADNTARGAYFTRLEVTNVTTMLQNGQKPPQITGAAAAQLINPQTGQPFTPADFAADGYQWNGTRYVDTAAPQNTAPATASTPVTTGIGTGSAEFMGTGFMQKNIANQTEFTKQLRWDPERKRYVQLGTLIKEGRLNVKDPKARLRSSKRGREEQVAAPVVALANNAPDTPTNQLKLVLGSG